MSNDYLRNMFEAIDPTRNLTDVALEELLSTDQLLERVHAETTKKSGWPWSRKWGRVGIITTSAVLVLSGTAAAFTLLRSPVQNTTELSCFTSATPGSDATVVSLSTHPLRTCDSQMHWITMPDSSHPNGVLCILSNGSIGGFPPSRKLNECRSLGLATYDGRPRNADSAAFQEAAQSYFATHQCQSLSNARTAVTRLLREHDVSNWHVRVSGSTAPGACATLAVQVSKKTVDIVGIKF